MAKTVAGIQIKPIGYFHGVRISKAALPRQGHLSSQTGFIEFEKGFDHKLALSGLEQMSHLWVIYYFHEALSEAKPLVRPPRAPEVQVGVYATRSPYRPNKIGLTLAKIDNIEKGRLYLSHMDLLDQTPILDLKPYIHESDQVLNPQQGWVENIQKWAYQLSTLAEQQVQWLSKNGLPEINDVLEAQLGTNPLQPQRKRIEAFSEPNTWILSYRTWRLLLKINVDDRISQVLQVDSGYSEQELNSHADPYEDKDLHRKYSHFIFNSLGSK